MDATKLLAAGLVVLLSMGGAVAASGGLGADATAAVGNESPSTAPTNVDAAVTYENGTATLTVTGANGTGVENLTVYANGEKVGTTDANGTVTFDASNVTHEDENELEVEFEGDHVEGELTYELHDGTLTLVEEKVEYERPDEAEQESEEKDEDEAEEDEKQDEETDESEDQKGQEGDENEDGDAAGEDDEDEVKDEEEDDEDEQESEQ